MIEPLVSLSSGPAFHVVAPSLPGYAFSTPLSGPGWPMGRTARAWIELMRRLGYDRYGVHVVTDPLTAANAASFIAGMIDGSTTATR